MDALKDKILEPLTGTGYCGYSASSKRTVYWDVGRGGVGEAKWRMVGCGQWHGKGTVRVWAAGRTRGLVKCHYLLLSSPRSAAACTKDSYGRGVGTVLDTCPDGYEKQGALCYPACPSGWQYG